MQSASRQKLLTMQTDPAQFVDRALSCLDAGSARQAKNSAFGSYKGFAVRISVYQVNQKTNGAGGDPLTKIVNGAINYVLGTVLEKAMPFCRVTIAFECNDPLSIILQGGSMGDQVSFAGIRKTIISNDIARCKNWLATPAAKESVNSLLQKHGLNKIEKLANSKNLELIFDYRQGLENELIRILDAICDLLAALN